MGTDFRKRRRTRSQAALCKVRLQGQKRRKRRHCRIQGPLRSVRLPTTIQDQLQSYIWSRGQADGFQSVFCHYSLL